MGLKDFDASKLRNFRYDSIGAESKTPQTFGDDHSGTTVTGARDKILEQFLNPGEPITVNTGASVFDDTNPPTPQTYTISHAGGEATISGLKGSVNFDGIDDLKSKRQDNSPYEISLKIFELHSKIARYFIEKNSITFFMGGDNYMVVASNDAKESVQTFIDMIKNNDHISLNCGIGNAQTSRDAVKLATKSLDTIRDLSLIHI